MKRVIAVVLCGAMFAGCATAPDKVSANYVSPIQYESYDCDQIREEMARVAAHVQEVAGVQGRAHTRDEVAMGVGLVIFWPALFFLMEGDKKEELANLKGQYDALDEAAIQKRCPVAEEIRAANAAEYARRHGKHHGQPAPNFAAPASDEAAPQASPVAPVASRSNETQPNSTRAAPQKCKSNGLTSQTDPDAVRPIGPSC